jgi:hypothetical protein
LKRGVVRTRGRFKVLWRLFDLSSLSECLRHEKGGSSRADIEFNLHVQINLYTLHMPILQTKQSPALQSSYKCLPDTPQKPPATSRSRESTVFHSRRTSPLSI